MTKITCAKMPASHGCKTEINEGRCGCDPTSKETKSVEIILPHKPKNTTSLRPPKGCVSANIVRS